MNTFQNILDTLLREVAEDTSNNLSEEEIRFRLNFLDIKNKTALELSESILLSLKQRSEEQLKLVRADMSIFFTKHTERWKEGFDALEILIIVCSEVVGYFKDSYNQRAVEEQNIKFDLVVRLYARACHISSEILWLLKGGFADAAQARWRTLHEVVVVALFLLEHSNELSIRYRDHEAVGAYKAIVQYNEYQPRLNIKEFSQNEIKKYREACDKVVNKHGKDFKKDYGWAADVLNNSSPNFFNLEKAVKLDHLRPYYKWASQNVHANVRGIGYKLGSYETEEDILLLNSSSAGITDPADLTAMSLKKISFGLLEIYPNVDSMVIQYIIQRLGDDVGECFGKVGNQD